MVSIIISGHGEFSLGLMDAFEMIFGKDENIKAVPFLREEGGPQLEAKFEKVISELDSTDEILFLVDVFGGTPYNTAARVVISNEHADIISGVSLPMLLEAASMKEYKKLNEITAQLAQVTAEGIKVFSEQLKQMQITEDDEEDLL